MTERKNSSRAYFRFYFDIQFQSDIRVNSIFIPEAKIAIFHSRNEVDDANGYGTYTGYLGPACLGGIILHFSRGVEQIELLLPSCMKNV